MCGDDCIIMKMVAHNVEITNFNITNMFTGLLYKHVKGMSQMVYVHFAN